MKERSFDEMIAYFNCRVADMDISQDCKMELLGMVTALGYKHEKSAQRWIPCSERLPEEKMNPIKQFIENLKNRYAIREIERQEKLLEEKVAEKKAKEEREAKREAKKSMKKVVNKPKPNLEVGLDKKVVKQEDTQKKRFLDPIQFKFYIVKQDLFKNIKKEFDNPEKKEINRQHRTAKKLLKEKQVQEKKEIVKTKQVKIKPKKEVKTAKKKSLKDSLKLKYQDFKIQNAKKQDEKTKIKTVEEPKKYQYLIE